MRARGRERGAGRREGGFSAVEIALAAALGGVLAAAGVATLGAGARVSRESVARQAAAREAGRLLESISRELRDASASTVAASSARPDEIAFRRVTGWDDIAAAPALSGRVTLRLAAVDLASGERRFVVERFEEGAPTSRLGSLVAARDSGDPTLPGLWFAVRFEGAATIVDIAATVDAPCGEEGAAVVRATTSVRLASE